MTVDELLAELSPQQIQELTSNAYGEIVNVRNNGYGMYSFDCMAGGKMFLCTITIHNKMGNILVVPTGRTEIKQR